MPARSQKPRRILARAATENFVGRAEHLRELVGLASPKAGPQSVVLRTAPQAGASELLRQAFDELFRQRGGPTPVYFAFTRTDHAATAAARRFLQTFLTQAVAHRRDDHALVGWSPTLRSVLDLVAPQDFQWVESLVQTFERAVGDADERALVRLCLDAPREPAAHGVRTVVFFDDVHLSERLRGEVEFGPELAHAAVQSGAPFVLAGLRRRVLDILNGTASHVGLDGLRCLHLERLREADARAFAEALAQQHGVELSEETRDLVVQQLESSPYLITALVEAARGRESALASFRDFQSLYVDELLGGRIHRRFAAVLEEVAPSLPLRRNLLRVLHESSSNVGGKSPAEVWMKRLSLDALEFERVMRLLHMHELASFQATFVETTPSAVWRDYLRVSYRLHVSVEPRALVVADTLVESLKRAPQTMARHYRRESALGLDDLMRRFDFESVPASLMHYDRFARMYRGVAREEVQSGLETETDLVRLPQIVHAASCASFHPPMLQFCDEERCAVAHGFDAPGYSESNEVVWMAAEIESKLEAGRALTELWLERLEQFAYACGFGRVKVWLLSPAGLSAGAGGLLGA